MNTIFRTTGTLIEKKGAIIIILALLLIIPLGLAATGLETKMGNDTFVSSDSEVYQDYEKFTDRFSDDVIVIMLVGEDLPGLLQQQNMAAMETLEAALSDQEHVVSVIGPVFAVRQVLGDDPEVLQDTQKILTTITDSDTGEIRPDFSRVFPDNQHAFIAITIDASISKDEKSDFIDIIEQLTDSATFTDDTDTIVTGYSFFTREMAKSLQENMVNMVIMAIFIMLIILAAVFKVQGFFTWRWLPISVVFLGIIYAFGLMGRIGIPITPTTIAVFPILIGLGVDYAIQFHNRYDEQSRKSQNPAEAAIDSVTHIGPAVGIAIVAACLGFIALFFSPVPMIRDFGLTLIIGVVECYILSQLLLIAVLYRRDRRKMDSPKASEKKRSGPKEQRIGFVERGLSRLAPWVVNHPILIISIAVVVTVSGLIADSHIDTITDETEFLNDDVQVAKDLDTLQALGGGLMSTNLFIEGNDVTDPKVLEWMLQVEQRVKEEKSTIVAGTESIADMVVMINGGQIPQTSEEIKDILDFIPVPIKRNLITDDLTAANVFIFHLDRDSDPYKELGQYLKDEVVTDYPDSMDVTVTGVTQIKVKLFDSLTSGREKMSTLGVILVLLGLILLFKLRIIRAFLAIIPIALIIGWSSLVMYLADIEYTPISATLGALIIGIGVEFTILLMMRYYEELAKGKNARAAMITSIVTIGRAISASGFTVIGGFGALLIAKDFPILQDFGIVTMVNVFFALVATLIVLPPMIVRVDTWRERRSQK